MRPSLYHRHTDERAYPGELDVHGAAPRPRYNEFDSTAGAVYAAYTDRTVVDELLRVDAIYRHDYGALVDRAHLELKLAPRGHWIYGAVPYMPTERTVVVWWRRPRRYARDEPLFPFRVGDHVTAFADSQHLAAFTVRVTAYDAHRGRAATGWMACEVLYRHDDAPGYTVVDLRRALR